MFASVLPLLLLAVSARSALYWPSVKHVFSFGDSYTDTYSRFVNGTLSASQDSKVRRSMPTGLALTRFISQRLAGRCGSSG